MTNTVGDAQIKLGLDASGVVTGIGEAKKSIDSLGPATQKGIAPISPEMEKASAATQRFAREVLKTEIALISGGKQTAAYKQAIAELNGLGTNALKPYLESLRATEQAQRAATAATLSGSAALNGMGISAKQTAAALRQVPAQFTDIIVSLQGGQAPLTVLLQQGGQLKDVFGGVGNAARALGGYIASLVNPFTVAAAAIGGVAFAFEKGAQEQREFQKALILTGNASGVTANLLSQAAASIDAVSGATQGKAAEALLVFVNAGVRGREELERFTASAIEFERAGGGSIEKVAENFAKLGKDPLKASLELNDSMNFLTRSIYEQIKALEDQGRSTEAAKLAQEAYNAALNDRTPQLLQNLGLIERGWKAITDATKGAYDAALSIGRAPTRAEQIDSLRGQIDQRQGRNASLGIKDGKATEDMRQQLSALVEVDRLEAKVAATKADQTRQVKALAEFDKLRDQFLDKQVKKEREIAQAREVAAKAGITGKALSDVEAGINKKYEEKGPSGVGDLNRGISAQIEALKAGAAIKAEIARQEADTRSSEFKRGFTNVLQFIEQEKQANLDSLNARKGILEKELALSRGKKDSQVEQARLAGEIALNEAQAATVIIKAQNDIAEAKFKQAIASQAVIQAQRDEDLAAQTAFMLANAAARNAGEKAVRDYAKSIEESNSFTEFELGLMGQSDQARSVAIEQYKIQIDLKKQLAAINANTGFNAEDRAAATATATEAAARAAANAGSKVFLDEWKKTTETISSSLTDALLRGFESGKGFGDNLKDTFKNLSKTLVLKPIIEMPVKQAAAALAPLQQKFTEFIATQILGQQQLTASAVTGSATIVAAKQVEGQAAATAGIANQAGGDPYSAFFRIAAMTALMAGLGFAVKGGSKSSGASPTNQGTGTVFGDSTAKSASIENSTKLLTENSTIGLRYSAEMVRSLRNIEQAFAGVTNLVLRNGEIGALEGKINTGYSDSALSSFLGKTSVVSNLFGNLVTKLFGKQTTIQGSGILGSPQLFGDIQDVGFQGNYYADVQTKSKFFGITTSTKNSTVLNPLDEELSRQFTQILGSIGDSVVLAGGALGLNLDEITAKLNGFVIDLGKINLKGLSGEQIQEQLAAVFGAASDVIARNIIPGLEAIQKVGEGYFETLVRAANQLETVNDVFGRLGGTLSIAAKGAGGIDQAISADQLVQDFGGLDKFTESTGAFYDAFYSDQQKARDGLSAISRALDGVGVALPKSNDAFRDLTTSIDVTTEAGRQAFATLVTLGPAFADLQNSLLDAADISTGSIANVLRDGLTGRITQEDLGQSLSEIIIDGFKNALANGVSQQISQAFTNQIIAPMLQAIATGGAVSSAVSQGTIDSFLTQAKAQIEVYTKVISDPAIQTALEQLNAGLTGVTGAMGGLAAASNTAEKLLSQANISASSISNVLRDGLTGRLTQEDLGKKLSDIVINGFNNALAQGVADQISQSFTTQIIGPMLQAIAAGGVVSSAVSQATINDFVAQAEAQIKLYTQVISSPAVQIALAQLNTGLNGVTSAMSGLTGSLQGVAAAAAEVNKYTANGADVARANAPWIQAAEDAQRASDEAREALRSMFSVISDEIKRIKGEIAGDSQSASLAQFTTLTAQARAGGLDALKELPSASQAYLSLVKENAGSLLELRRAQGFVIGSLEQTQQTLGLAPASGAVSPIVYQGPAQVSSTPVTFESLLQELRSANERLKTLELLASATEANTKSVAENIDGIASGKKTIQTEAA